MPPDLKVMHIEHLYEVANIAGRCPMPLAACVELEADMDTETPTVAWAVRSWGYRWDVEKRELAKAGRGMRGLFREM